MESPKYSKPLVSIGMPAYNGERYIKKALDSLLAQDYENFELIISDNASTDATLRICREYADNDKRVNVYAQNHNVGSLANFKTVLKPARGKYFMWAAVDDLWMPEFVSAMVKELETHADAGVAMCAVNRIYEDGTLFDTVQFKGKDDPNNRTYYQMMKSLTSGKKYNLYIYGLFRTQLLKESVPFLPEVPVSDRLFICHMTLATRFRYIDQVLHIRMYHKQPSAVRWPNEKFNKMQNEKWINIKILIALGRIITQSHVIPFHRKLYTPVALWRYGRLLLLSELITKLKEKITLDNYNRIRKFRKFLFK